MLDNRETRNYQGQRADLVFLGTGYTQNRTALLMLVLLLSKTLASWEFVLASNLVVARLQKKFLAGVWICKATGDSLGTMVMAYLVQ